MKIKINSKTFLVMGITAVIILAGAAAYYFFFALRSAAPALNTYYDSKNNFSLVFPQAWLGKVGIAPGSPFGNTTVFEYRGECGDAAQHPPLFMLAVMPDSQWNAQQESQGYALAADHNGTSYAYKVSDPSLCKGSDAKEFSLFLSQVAQAMKTFQFK